MATVDLSQAPVFLTREDAATLLRLHARSIDRLAKQGELEKQALSDGRVGIHRDDVAEYLERRGHQVMRAGASASASTATPANTQGDGDTTSDLATSITGLVLDGAAAIGGTFIDQALGGAFPAVSITVLSGDVLVTWPTRVGYRRDDVLLALVQAIRSEAQSELDHRAAERA